MTPREQIIAAKLFAKQGLKNPDSALEILRRVANWDIEVFRIYKGGEPSASHSSYLDEDAARKEVVRLENIRINVLPSLSIEDHQVWTYQKYSLPK